MSKKKEDLSIFEENRRLQGWNISVLDDWGVKIKKRFITEEEKERYLEEFGEKIISESEFMRWWCRVNHYSFP